MAATTGAFALAGCTTVRTNDPEPAERAPEPPTVFTRIRAVLELSGGNLRDSDVEWAVALAREKYCQVDVMLEKAVPIDLKWEIIE